MPGLVPGIHVFFLITLETWMAGTSPAMTVLKNSRFAEEYQSAIPPSTRWAWPVM